MPEERKPHGLLGFVTCVPDERWTDDEFVQAVGHALVGLVPLRFSELSSVGSAELEALAQKAAATIASKGDVFQYPTDSRRKNWKPSGVLSELVTAYAVLALNSPEEGITKFGIHACFWEHEGCPKNQDR